MDAFCFCVITVNDRCLKAIVLIFAHSDFLSYYLLFVIMLSHDFLFILFIYLFFEIYITFFIIFFLRLRYALFFCIAEIPFMFLVLHH